MRKLFLPTALVLVPIFGLFAQSQTQQQTTPPPQNQQQTPPPPQGQQPTANQQSNSQPAPSAPIPTKPVAGSKVFLEKMGGFENYLAAAFAKKKVQLVIVANKDLADYVIGGTSEDKKAGWAKIIFLGDIHSDATASVTMVDKKSSAVLFAYAVNKKNT